MPSQVQTLHALTRRSLLRIATASAGAVTVGAAARGLLGTLSPTADVAAFQQGIDIQLSNIIEGTQITVPYLGRTVIVRHRTAVEIFAAEDVDLDSLIDLTTRDVHGRITSSADDRARRATPDGKFIALYGVEARYGCAVISSMGDWNAWFDPCVGAHFDSSGRVRKNGGQNLRLPVFELIGADTLRLIINPNYVNGQGLDDLLYR